MWSRGGRSSALDRAQTLLSGKRDSKSAAGSIEWGAPAKTPGNSVAVGGSLKARSAPTNTHPVFQDLSDLSSVSDHGEGTMGSAAAWKSLERDGESPKDPRPQTSLGGGGGSRFLKKAPPPAATSSQSPTISKTQMQKLSEPRCVSSSQHGSQSAALSRLALIEDRIRSRKESQPQVRGRAAERPKPAQKLASEPGFSPQPPASPTLEASRPLSARSSPSPKGKRFIKKTASVAVDSASSPKGPGASVKTFPESAGLFDRSGAVQASMPFADLTTKPTRVAGGVSLDSDEEDMRKLLGDSFDSTEESLLRAGRPSSMRTAGKLLSRNLKVSSSTSPPAAVRPPSRSPPRRRSPFRFSGQAQAQFSPSALSPSPSPPGRRSVQARAQFSPSVLSSSLSPTGRRGSPPRPGSPRRSLSSLSGRSEVLSLAELFPAAPGSDASHCESSSVSSEAGQQDFKINVMSLDDLVPVSLEFTVETAKAKERQTKPSKHKGSAPGALTGDQQLPGQKEKQEIKRGEEQEYQSDFESESRIETDHSASQVSERLGGESGEEDGVSRASDRSRGRTEVDYSSSFASSATSRSYVTRTSGRSPTAGSLSRSRESRCSVSHGERSSSRPARRRSPPCRALKEAAVQTHPDLLAYTWSAGMATMGPAVGTAYVDPTPVASHTVSAETVEALSTYSPAVLALNDMLRQQLALSRQFVESSRHLHSCLVHSLGPDYRYTTLEDTEEFIHKHKPPKLTVEEALEEVLQEMRDYHYI